MRCWLIFSICLILSGSIPYGRQGATQEEAISPDVRLYAEGMRSLKRRQFDQARRFFENLVHTYPAGQYTPAALLAIASSYYAEAGRENLLLAEAQFRGFIRRYPDHEMADDAQLKVATINLRLMKSQDHDPTYASRAEAELKAFLENYPDSELVPTARQFLRQVQDTLGQYPQDEGVLCRGVQAPQREPLRTSGSVRPLRSKEPNYPDAAGTLRIFGLVLLQLVVNEQGRVWKAEAVQGDCPSSFLRQ